MANKEIRTIMAALTEGHVLLPSTAVAEVADFTEPEPFKQSPAWLLGELAWRGWQVPVIDYLRLIDDRAGNAVTGKARILIIKTLGESTQVNYIGLVIQGLPKLKTVTPKNLKEQKTESLPKAQFSKVSVDDLPAMIPELGYLTGIVEQAAYAVN
jgi:chemosensory pili system protein ChpC